MKNLCFKFVLIICFSAISTSWVLFAQDTSAWDKEAFEASPEILYQAVKDMPLEEGENINFLLRERHVVIRNDGSIDHTNRYIYALRHENAIQDWSQTSQSWAPWYEDRPEIRARVINNDGSETWLESSQVVEVAPEDENTIFTDWRKVKAPFPNVQADSIIEEMATVKATRPFFKAGTVQNWHLEPGHSQILRRLIIDVAPDVPFRYKIHGNIELEPEITEIEGFKRYTFLQKNLRVNKKVERNLPYDQSPWPRLDYSTCESWETIAKVYTAMAEDSLQGETFDWLPQEAFQEGKPFETAVKLTHWLNNRIRYTGWELGESALKPTPPKQCMERGYGDCKDKALMIVGMLRKLGFQADIALLRSGLDFDVDPELPGMGRFNHAIVAIHDGDQTQWLDPTDEFSREGILHYSNQGRWALIANSESKALTKIPVQPMTVSGGKEIREYVFSSDGEGDVKEKAEYFGNMEYYMRSSYHGLVGDQFKEQLKNYATSTYRNGKIAEAAKIESTDFSKPFSMDLHIESSGRMNSDDFEDVMAVMLEDALESLPRELASPKKDAPKRQKPFLLKYPYTYSITYMVPPRDGFVWLEDPKDETVELGSGKISYRIYQSEGGLVKADIQFESGPREISPEMFEKYKADLKKFKDNDTFILRFAHEGLLAKNQGQHQKSMTIFRDLAKAHPTDIHHQQRYIRALKEAGLIERATEVTREACKANPESSEAFTLLGTLLQTDPMGRWRQIGYDRQGAIDAYLKAMELDPENHEARAELAILYEFDDKGLRYTEASDMDKALEQYLLLREKNPKMDLEANIQSNLVESNSYKKLREETERIKDKEDKTTLQVIATIGQEGLEAGFKETNAIVENDLKQAVFERVGQYLLKKRAYQDGSKFLRLAAQGSSDARELEGRAQFLGAMKRFDPETFEKTNTPENIIQRIFLTLFNSRGLNDSSFEDFFTIELNELEKEESSGTFTNLEQSFYNASSELDLSMEIFMDITMNMLEVESDSDGTTGFRSKVYARAIDESSLLTAFFAGEGDKRRIIATEDYPQFLAVHALKILQKGNLKAGEKWLEWHVEASGGSSLLPKFRAPSILQIWNIGDEPDKDLMTAYAAAGILQADYDKKAYKTLEKYLPKLEGRAVDAAKFALAKGDAHRDAHEKAQPVAEALNQKFPADILVLDLLAECAANTKKSDTFEKALPVFLEKDRGDQKLLAKLLLAQTKSLLGQFEETMKMLIDLESKGEVNSTLYNKMAWLSLFIPGYEKEAQTWVEKAAQFDKESYAISHTVAAIYAEQGRCPEARETLLKAINQKEYGAIESSDWYVWGRMAEQYGEVEAAIAMYKRVTEERKGERGFSSKTLAERRLTALQRK